jgi:hypothetical protein
MSKVLIGKGNTSKAVLSKLVDHGVVDDALSLFFGKLNNMAFLIELVLAVLDDLLRGTLNEDSDAIVIALFIVLSALVVDGND